MALLDGGKDSSKYLVVGKLGILYAVVSDKKQCREIQGGEEIYSLAPT
jgi:hypothetical protein